MRDYWSQVPGEETLSMSKPSSLRCSRCLALSVGTEGRSFPWTRARASIVVLQGRARCWGKRKGGGGFGDESVTMHRRAELRAGHLQRRCTGRAPRSRLFFRRSRAGETRIIVRFCGSFEARTVDSVFPQIVVLVGTLPMGYALCGTRRERRAGQCNLRLELLM